MQVNKTFCLKKGSVGAAVLCAALLPVNVANADVWKYWGSFSAEVGIDSNIRLRADQNNFGDKGNIYGGELLLEANRFSDKYDLQISAGGDYKNYFNDDESDRAAFIAPTPITNPLRAGFQPRVGIAGQYRIDERQELSTALIYREEQTNDAVASTSLDDVSIGFNGSIIERTLKSAALAYKRSLTERLKGEVSYTRSEREYDVQSLSDNESNLLAVATRYRVSEKNEFLTDLEYLDYSSGLVDVARYGALVGISHAFTPVTSLRANIGYIQQETTDVNSGRSASSGELEGKIVLNHQGERSSLTLIAERRQKPSVSGVFVETNLVSARGSYGLTERVSTSLVMRWFDNKRGQELDPTAVPGSSGDNRTYFSFAPQLNWSFTEKWATYVRFEYRQQDRKDFNEKENSNAIYFGVQFKPLKEI